MAPQARTNSPVEAVVTVRLLLSPVRSRTGHFHWQQWDAPAGQPLCAYLPDRLEEPAVIVDGKRIQPADWARPLSAGQEITIMPAWGPPVAAVVAGVGLTQALVTAAISIGISLALTGISMLLFPSKKPKLNAPTTNGEESPTYGWQGITTTTGPGSPVPIIYGQHRVGGQLISAYVDAMPAEQQVIDSGAVRSALSMQLALGEGNVYLVDTGTVEINDQLSSNFPEIDIQWRPGLPDQTAMNYFSQIANTFALDAAFDTAAVTYTTSDTLVDAYVLEVKFPEGLYWVDDRQNYHQNTARYTIEDRLVGAGAWTNRGQRAVSSNKRVMLRYFHRQEGLTPGQYEIRVSFNGADNTTEDTSGYKPTLGSVTEIRDDTETYPNTALLGLRAIATERLSGAVPNVTVQVMGRVLKYWTGATYGETFSQSPAWALRDFLTNTRYGLAIPESSIDDTSFLLYHAYCAQEVSDGNGGTEGRCQLDYVLDSDNDDPQVILQQPAGTRR